MTAQSTHTSSTHPSQDDLAYLRRLAEDSQTAPSTVGPYLVAAGIIFGSACLICWVSQLAHWLSPIFETGIWVVAVVVMYLVSWTLSATLSSKPRNLVNRVTGSLWRAIGRACVALLLAGIVLNYRFHTDEIWALMPSAIMVLYGVGWMTTAVVMRKPMINSVSLGAMIAGVVLALVDGFSCFYLVLALCFVLLMLLPGLKLMRLGKQHYGE